MSPPTNARLVGSFPTWTSRLERVFGSSRETVPLWLFATHTAPFRYTIPTGELPAETFDTFPLPRSKRETVSSGVFATQTAPDPTAIPVGPFPIDVLVAT